MATGIEAGAEPPSSIVYIPEGEHEITPLVDGKPKTIKVRLDASRGEAIAAAFQTALMKRAGQNVRPIFDFDHANSGPASAIPKAFRYEAGRGLIADVEWTGKGKEAIAARDYAYFSPTFLMAQDGTPSGLPERGPLGALVNDPAFREIERIAAANAAQNHPLEEPTNMTTALILATCGLLSETEAAKDDATTLATKRVSAMQADSKKVESLNEKITAMEGEIDKLKRERDELKAEAKSAVEASAQSAVDAAVDAGRIAPKDEDTKTFWKESIIARGESAIKAMNALPVSDPTKAKAIVKASDQTNVNNVGDKFIAEARALVSAKRASTESEAYGILAVEQPDLYASYSKQFAEAGE